MELTTDTKREIELILEQANDWGLSIEVDTSAKQYIREGHSIIDAYHFGYEDWIK